MKRSLPLNFASLDPRLFSQTVPAYGYYFGNKVPFNLPLNIDTSRISSYKYRETSPSFSRFLKYKRLDPESGEGTANNNGNGNRN